MGTIKSFKKFIEESIWSDMQDRSMGKTVRKEDEYDIDEKELERSVDTCIRTYVISSVYYDKYDGSSDTFLKCIQEWDRCICGNPHLYDRRFGKYVEPIKVIPSYVKKNWETGKSYKSLVDKKMSEEEKKVKDTGFIKKPGESISDTLSKWFDENFEKLGDDFCEEIEEYNERYHNEGGSMSVDLDVEDWWDNLEYIEQVEIYQDYMKKTNESIWSDMQDRSAGDTVRQEEFTEEFIDKVKSNLIGFTMLVVYYIKNYELTLDGFYKYLEENENPDEVKKIIYYVKTHKDECDKLLEKDIKFENKLLDEKVNVYLLRFVDDIVYGEKYHNTLSDIKKFASEIFKGYKYSYDFHINKKLVFKYKFELFNDYIEDKWKNSSLKQKIDDWIKDENDKISKYGFVKEPGKTISETVNDWWYSLDEDKRNDLGWDEFGDDAEEEYYTDNNPKYNEYTGEDFEADEWWDAAYGIRKVKIYCSEHSKTNESIWSDMQDRSMGKTVRKEDERHIYLERLLATYVKLFAESRCNGDEYIYNCYPYFISYIKDFRDNPRIEEVCPNDSYFDDLLDYVNVETWDNQIYDTIMEITDRIEKGEHLITDDVIEELRKHNVNESIWSDMQDRSAGYGVREEDITEEDKKEIDYIFNGFAYLIVYTDYKPTIDDFIKMMKEAYPDKDSSKYIAWIRSKWDKKYKDELDKKIQRNKKDVDKRINIYLNNFVGQIVYCEKYNVSLSDIKKFSDEVLKHDGMLNEMSFVGKIRVNKSWCDIFKKYVDENWNDVKKRINDLIVEENQEIAKTGFKKTPGKKICDILDEWWDSLGDEKDDIAWNEFGERAEEKYYEEHNSKYNEYTGEDFDADEEWSDTSWIESVEIYMKYNQKTNESIWSDMQDRSSGETVRKEDEMNDDDFFMLRKTAEMFRNFMKRNRYASRMNTCDNFIKYIERRKEEHFWTNVSDEAYDKVIRFAQKNWGDCTDIQEFMDKYLSNINECDGVPGGLTPADVGGMGPAYFPGPNGEPGSGDLPSPTGIVYKQVAPFDSFIKIRKQKKKKKKFRKEDEPYAHSPNTKVYDYVDDFRDYVDRTYNNIDKRK